MNTSQKATKVANATPGRNTPAGATSATDNGNEIIADINEMTKKQLREQCAQHRIDTFPAMLRADLRRALENATNFANLTEATKSFKDAVDASHQYALAPVGQLFNERDQEVENHANFFFKMDGVTVVLRKAPSEDFKSIVRRLNSERGFNLPLNHNGDPVFRVPEGLNLSIVEISIADPNEQTAETLRAVERESGGAGLEGLTADALLHGLYSRGITITGDAAEGFLSQGIGESTAPTKGLITLDSAERLVAWLEDLFGGLLDGDPVEGQWKFGLHSDGNAAFKRFCIYSTTKKPIPGLFPRNLGDYPKYILRSYERALTSRKPDDGRKAVKQLAARVNAGIALGLIPFALPTECISAPARALIGSATNERNAIDAATDIIPVLAAYQKKADRFGKLTVKSKFALEKNSGAERRLLAQHAVKDYRPMALKATEMRDLKHDEAVKMMLHLLGIGPTSSAMSIIGSISFSAGPNVTSNLPWLKATKGGKSEDDKFCYRLLEELEQTSKVYPYDWVDPGFYAKTTYSVAPRALNMKGKIPLSGWTLRPTAISAPSTARDIIWRDGAGVTTHSVRDMIPALEAVEYTETQIAKARQAVAGGRKRGAKPHWKTDKGHQTNKKGHRGRKNQRRR
jgi:hypothetical protein